MRIVFVLLSLFLTIFFPIIIYRDFYTLYKSLLQIVMDFYAMDRELTCKL